MNNINKVWQIVLICLGTIIGYNILAGLVLFLVGKAKKAKEKKA